jgi:hypothetical protein
VVLPPLLVPPWAAAFDSTLNIWLCDLLGFQPILCLPGQSIAVMKIAGVLVDD